ncbi:MAG: N-acetyltransferase [Desulfobacter sp.]|nr:MAG: N-acetyltransferase [Desulfobacter sp.]
MKIRNSYASDRQEIERIHTMAFGKEKGPEIAELVNGLFGDNTAAPLLSLVAVEDNKLVGHVLFTKVDVAQSPVPVSARILAPLAVLPEVQKTGIGGLLIEAGFNRLKQSGVDLVFVLGHPDYYPRSGFTPAGAQGYEAPYPIPEEHAGAWMVIELSAGMTGRAGGRVRCSNVLNQPRHWRE